MAAFVFSASLSWAADLTASDLDKLSNYENKLFSHPFKTDSVDARLDRIEDFVFGKTSDGSDSDRLSNVVSAMGAAETESPKDVQAASLPAENAIKKKRRDTEESPSTATDTAGNNKVANLPSASQTQNYADAYADAKPEENAHQLHKKGQSQPVADTAPKAYGSAAAQTAGRDPIETGEGFKKSDYPRVSKLELRLLGLTYDQDPLDERVDRLEIKVFKKPSTIDDIGQRIDALEKLIPPSHKVAYAPASDSDDQVAPPSRKSNSHSDWDEGEGKIASAPPSATYDYPDSYSSAQSDAGADPSAWTNQSFSINQLMGGGRGSFSANGAISQGTTSGFYSPPPSSSMRAPLGASAKVRSQSGSLDKQAEAMEKEVLGKTFKHDGLVDRLNRLEAIVFPGQPAPQGMNVPQRFERLQEALGTSVGTRTASASGDDRFNNNSNPNQTGVVTAQQKSSFLGSLGKALGAIAGGAANSFNSTNNGYGGYGSPYGYASPYGYSPYGGSIYSPYGGYGGYSPYAGYTNFGSPFGGIGGFGSSPFGFGSPFGGTYTGLPGTGFGGMGGGIGNPVFGGANRVRIF